MIHQLLHQVIKLARKNNCYKLDKPLIFLKYIENRNTFRHFLKTYSDLVLDDDLVLRSNRIVIPSDLQNHVVTLAH